MCATWTYDQDCRLVRPNWNPRSTAAVVAHVCLWSRIVVPRPRVNAIETGIETDDGNASSHAIMVTSVCPGSWRRMRDLNPRGF
jgi:hypothetical protein